MALREDITIPIPGVKNPGLPSEQDTVGFGEKIANFIIEHPTPFAVIVVLMLLAGAWKIPKVRAAMIFAAGIVVALWAVKQGLGS